jgi:hypothetical protein
MVPVHHPFSLLVDHIPVKSFQIWVCPGNTKGGSITVPLTSCLTGLESAVWLLTILFIYLQKRLIQTSQTGGQWYSDISIFPPLVFPGLFKGPITIKSNVTKDLSKIKWLYYGQYFVTYLNITIITAHTKCKVYTFVSLRF